MAGWRLVLPGDISYSFHSLHIGLRRRCHALGVDITAFVGGLCFVWMARATARRVNNGPADSIWLVRQPVVA